MSFLFILLVIFVLRLLLKKYKNYKKLIISEIPVSAEDSGEQTNNITLELSYYNNIKATNWPLPRMNDNYDYIFSVYKELNECLRKKYAIPSVAEWLLDNFYIIEEQAKLLRRDLNKKTFSLLPVINSGFLQGNSRIFAIILELVFNVNGEIDEDVLYKHLQTYQTHSVLFDREIWAIPVVIRLALLEYIRCQCKKIKKTIIQWKKADDMIDDWLDSKGEDEKKLLKHLNSILKSSDNTNSTFIEHLLYRLRRSGLGYTHFLLIIDEHLSKSGKTSESIAQEEHHIQSVNTLKMSNCISSLRYFTTMNWEDLFESLSFVDQILRLDPDGTYPKMNLASRNFYRGKVEELSSIFSVSPVHIAKEAVSLAKQAFLASKRKGIKNNKSMRLWHIGYYLIEKGLQDLKKTIGCSAKISPKRSPENHRLSSFLYLGSITLVSVIFVGLAIQYTILSSASHVVLYALIVGIAILIPASEVAISLINFIVCKTIQPAVFPKLELKEGIPENLSTMIVIPTLLPDEKRVSEILEKLESHYLSNREKNLYFALIGAFSDSDQETVENQELIIDTALSGIKELNHKYSPNQKDIFYFYHRSSIFNKKNNKWFGWERKRGALMEFNELVLGAKDTSFAYISSHDLPFSRIKYIITLDSDTILPMGMAKKMIGTMAHPLNTPVIDKKRGIVVEGYGIMQPRVEVDIESSNKSLFSLIFTGQEGIDPYANAISNVYQDLFEEGIFTGKGIYDLHVFQQVLKNAFPDNTILSHDLLEGSYVRTGLLTDLELVDSYPTRYNAYTSRAHRWTRGDWQLLPFLFGSIINRKNKRIANPLSMLSRWKIFDNLRRSLVAPSLILFFALMISVLPGNIYVWFGFFFLTVSLPFFLSVLEYLYVKRSGANAVKRHIPAMVGLKASFLQLLLTLMLMPYQAVLNLHAIVVTLGRLMVSKKDLLEWVTSADLDKFQINSLSSYFYKMKLSYLILIVFVIIAITMRPSAIILLLALFLFWGIAPYLAYLISLDKKELSYKATEEEVLMLHRVSRKTWRYFEELVDSRNHFLAPDNYQEDPLRGVAHRTSPTNIGIGLLAILSARDFGYITTSEMIDMINNTISTITSLEKWEGHLYNWYDTKTLRPLHPEYISTVDSGNFLCFMVSLEQGLEEHLQRPLIDHMFLQGIKDTILCGGKEGLLVYKKMLASILLNRDEAVDLIWWSKLLENLADEILFHVSKESVWKNKYVQLVTKCQQEVFTFFPWIDLLKRVPQVFLTQSYPQDIDVLVQNLLAMSSNAAPLSELPSIYKDSIECANTLIDLIAQNQPQEFPVALAWLNEWKDVLQNATLEVERLIMELSSLKDQIAQLNQSMNFLPLFSKKKQLFSIGWNIDEDKLSNSYYDLLASEARQTSFICIARGEIPPSHWFKLGRALTVVDGYKGLVSWTGSMFEYLMPILLMKSYKNTLLDETYSFVIKSQKKYGRQRKMPWGASESGYNSIDQNLEYQYKAIGVPWLGLKRGLVEDAVCAPYATFLALLVDPQASIQNINYLIKEGLEGLYGFYEAGDYTKERLRFESKRVIAKSYMAHHQGMSFLALNNYLHDNIMQHRFHKDPAVNSSRFLLQEKIPSNLVITKESKVKVRSFKELSSNDKYLVRKFTQIDPILPKVHILSNGSYSVMLTDKGSGYSKNKLVSITRWREDKSLDQYGMFFYLRNIESNHVWSATYAPLNQVPEKYEVSFSADKATYKRLDQQIQTTTEVVVTPSDNVEIRRLTLKNLSEKTCIIEISSYFEVVLSPQIADVAHPAFQNLFVETQIHPEKNYIIAKRRPRSETDKTFWISNTVFLEGNSIGDVQFETDRMQMIGRGHSVRDPYVIEHGKPFSNTSGSVLDPIMSIRMLVKIEAGKTARISFVTAVSNAHEALRSLIEKYSNSYAVDGAFRLALTRSQIEYNYFNLTEAQLELYQNMLSHILYISPKKRKFTNLIQKNKKGQSSLWRYGISGDFPIVLLILQETNQVELMYEVLKAYDYWSSMDLKIDLIVLSEEEYCYDMPLCGLIHDIVQSKMTHKLLNKAGNVFILNKNTIEEEDLYLFHAVARIVLRGDQGSMQEQIDLHSIAYVQPMAKPLVIESEKPVIASNKNTDLSYFNGLGGFSSSGHEYLIQLEKHQHAPAPWINVIANPEFGFIASEAGSGFTWYENSHEYKLTPWSNDAVTDPPGEILYLTDSDTEKSWTVTAMPIRDEEIYTIRHGFGYSVFEHKSHELEQSLVQFVPVNETIKISLLSLKNTSEQERHLTLTYYVRPILGVSDQETAMFIQTKLDEFGLLMVENPYNVHFPGRITFLDASIRERTVTSDRKEFFGFSDYRLPDALSKPELSGIVGTSLDPCSVIQVKVILQPNESKDIVFLLGTASQEQDVHDLAERYNKVNEAKEALNKVQSFWRDKLSVLEVKTPADSINIMLNGWLPYQVISCRLWARSGFYQSGGAFGFRDQLQDCLSIAHIAPEIARAQILHHARRQFEEGDVQHWWHEPQGLGIRTHCSDDLLWLPYATAEYIRITGDDSILEEKLPFLQDAVLADNEVDRFSSPKSTEESYSLYEHCIRAIDYSFRFGEHELPLMGSGDWNDGMNTVGHKGSGESVWLGWFLITILKMFTPFCVAKCDESRSILYSKVRECLLDSIENNAWDGNWYLRAFFDDGTPLGSIQNKECKIDSIAQTWAVISRESNKDRVKIAMNSLEDHLISREEGLIKLISPPFYDSKVKPGYIKGYLPGVRENGGQYTHAAAWVIIAFAMMGDGDKAWELYELINPLNHTENLRECAHYKLEPYVMAADVYSGYPNKGRGGWSWYTGSAGWIYRAVLEYILGFQKNGDTLVMDPCIPKEWKEYTLNYQYLSSSYHLQVINPSNISKGVLSVSIDGIIHEGNRIALKDDGQDHHIVVTMGK
jgi:cellobiose phosphorylase